MSKVLLVFTSTMIYLFGFSQIENNANLKFSKFDSVRIKLQNDTIAFNHFLFAKKCLCLDQIKQNIQMSSDIAEWSFYKKNTKISKEAFDWMYYLGFSFFVLIKEEKLIFFLQKDIQTEINTKMNYNIDQKLLTKIY